MLTAILHSTLIDTGKEIEARTIANLAEMGINWLPYDTRKIGHDFESNYEWAQELSKIWWNDIFIYEGYIFNI